jgi:hypothetical protein
MPAAPEKLASLRHLLAERFPSLPRTVGRVLPTGLPALDEATGGLPLGAVTELVCAAPSCGGHLFLGQLLTVTRTARQRVALIDGSDSFDPASHSTDLLAHLVWIRCSGIAAALQSADLLTRDANLGLVVLDLRRATESELRRTPATQWYRLQRAVEPTDLALVVITPRTSVPSAQLRFILNASHPAAALEIERPALSTALAPTLQRQRLLTPTAVA